jgi:hypothetical protein
MLVQGSHGEETFVRNEITSKSDFEHNPKADETSDVEIEKLLVAGRKPWFSNVNE